MTIQSHKALPEYDGQLSHFHDAFKPELQAVLNALPLKPMMKVLDLACGDGFYTRGIAELLGPEGSVTGVDINLAFLKEAEEEARHKRRGGQIDFIASDFDSLPFPDDTFDFVWCAQSFFSLPEPVRALKQMHRVLRSGGLVAILENDSLHQISLPWPVHLELPLRAAELRNFMDENKNASKFYVGRRLPRVIAAGGFEPLSITTQAIDRQAPLGKSERAFLQSYLDGVAKRATPYLEKSLCDELEQLIDPLSPNHLLKDKYLNMTWLNVLAIGRKPLETVLRRFEGSGYEAK